MGFGIGKRSYAVVTARGKRTSISIAYEANDCLNSLTLAQYREACICVQ